VTLHQPSPFDNFVASLQRGYLWPSRVPMKSFAERVSDLVDGPLVPVPHFSRSKKTSRGSCLLESADAALPSPAGPFVFAGLGERLENDPPDSNYLFLHTSGVVEGARGSNHRSTTPSIYPILFDTPGRDVAHWHSESV